MGKTFSVESFNTMEKTGRALKDHAVTYDQIAKKLLMQGETISSWGGADQEAFVQKVQGLAERLQAVSSRLDLGGEILIAQKQNYVVTQDAVIEGVGKLQN